MNIIKASNSKIIKFVKMEYTNGAYALKYEVLIRWIQVNVLVDLIYDMNRSVILTQMM